jgi:hypothetical protein
MIGKAFPDYIDGNRFTFIRTVDNFTDKALVGGQLMKVAESTYYEGFYGRCQANPRTDAYMVRIDTSRSANDFILEKTVNGTITSLGTQAVDLADDTNYIYGISLAGSAVKVVRFDRWSAFAGSISWGTVSIAVSATDTTFTSGGFAVRITNSGGPPAVADGLLAFLRAPYSPSPEALALIEVDIAGAGTQEDPYRPALPQDLVEIEPANPTIPEFLRLEKRKYDLLRAKGFTDEEIKLLLGYIPQHQVDRMSITWGAIDFRSDPATGKPIATTYLIAVYDDPEKVLKHVKYARSRNMKVYTPPFDFNRVKVIHRIERRDRDWLITENELAYQILGREEFELDAVADFYERELIDLGRIKDVKEWILEETLAMWEERARRYGRDQALEKLKRVRRR